MFFYFLSIFIILLGGLLSFSLKNENKIKFCPIFLGASSIIMLFPSINSLFYGITYQKSFYISPIFNEISVSIDPLSAFFILIISIMSFIASIYAKEYLKSYLNKYNLSSHILFFTLLIASMLGVVCINNALIFLILWEIMSLSSFFLVIFENDKKEVINAGIKYLIYMHISVIFIILAFALLSINSNSLDFKDFSLVLNQNKSFANIIFFLSLIGFGTKAGFLPFHNWLPDAHPAAPSHISGIMSGVMIKTGIYGILRMIFLIGEPTKFIAYSILIIAIFSALWGVLYAITQHDIKRLLAYHSIENIGIIGIGIGIGLTGMLYKNPIVTCLGFAGGVLHILNHSIFKMLLFFTAGNIYQKTHTKNIEKLGGLIKKMPTTSLLFITGSIAICGLPPFNGFISEILIYAGIISGLPAISTNSLILLILSLSALALIGTMAILCFTKVTGIAFLGEPRSEISQKINNDVNLTMLIPTSILALLTLLIGLFPQYAILFILNPVFNITNKINIDILNSINEYTQLISLLFFILLSIIIIILCLKLLINKKIRIHTTWGCGYNKINTRMQYSASSYADLFISTLKPLFKRISHIKKPKNLFPKEAYYEVEIEDLEEAYIVKPLIKFDEKFLAKFEKIQNGNIQQYILFGLIFLILSLIGLILWG